MKGRNGLSVQLKHDGSDAGDGWVAVSLDGKELVRSNDVQHNRNYDERSEMLSQMAGKILAALPEP